MWLTNFALKRPVITAMFFIGIAIFGIISYRSLGVSLFPNVNFPIVVVSVGYPGASPSEMEKLVIKPIEDQLDGIDNLDRLRATAQEGVASVVIQFKLDTDLNFAVMDVQRRVDQARGFMPSDLSPPFVGKFSTASDPIMEQALSSKKLSSAQLSDLVVQQIIPALKRTPGVQDVDYSGVAEREFHVYPDFNRLLSTGATLADVNNAIAGNNANLPGGRLDAPTKETTVSIHADIVDPVEILQLPLTVPGGAQNNLKVGDVAAVDDGHVEQRQPTRFNGAPSIVLYVQRTIDADEIKTTEAARKTFDTLRKKYPDVVFTETDANADFTRASVNGVLSNLLEGIFLTAIVMLLFLHAWRNAVVVMIAIPTSLLATFIVMKQLGFTIDVISLMGLGLTIGILVDDSIVVLENITRHRDMGEAPMDAAYKGRTEIGQAAVAITLVDVVVFLPIAFLSGIVGKYMREFGVVIVVATLFSLLVSFTLTPLLAGRWSVKRRSPAVPVWARWFQTLFTNTQHFYSTKVLPLALGNRVFVAVLCAMLVIDAVTLPVMPLAALFFNAGLAVVVLAWFGLSRIIGGTSSRWLPISRTAGSARPAVTMAIVAVAIGGAFALLPKVGGEFIPSSETGVVSGTLTYPVGTPLAVAEHGLTGLETEIAKVAAVQSVSTTAGKKSAGGFGSQQGGNYAQFTAVLYKNQRSETNHVTEELRKLGWTVPGAKLEVSAQGGGSPISFTLTGPDENLNVGAEKLANEIRKQNGAVNVQTSAETEAPRLTIRIDPRRAATLGVSPGEAAFAARMAIGGAISTKVRTENKLVDTRIQLPVDQRNDLDTIRQVRVRSNTGVLVPLSRIADFDEGKAPTKIEREARARVVRVSAEIDTSKKVTQGDILGPVQKALNTPGFFPQGVAAVAADDTDLFNQTFTSMALALLTSFLLVYALMVVLYGSFFEPFIVMFSVPVALIGALVALSLRQQTLNLFSLIAIIMLFGLVAKNGILLVDYANQQLRRGLAVHDAIRAAALTRFRPILMTTCAMVFGMLPLALGITEGAKDRASMGTVLIGGLISSLILTLVLVPVVYTWVMVPIERWRGVHPSLGEEPPGRIELPSFEPVGAKG